MDTGYDGTGLLRNHSENLDETGYSTLKSNLVIGGRITNDRNIDGHGWWKHLPADNRCTDISLARHAQLKYVRRIGRG